MEDAAPWILELPRSCRATIFTGSTAASRNNSNNSGPPTTIAATESPLSSRRHRSPLIFRSPPLRKAKGDASAASRGMPGDKEKRAIPRTPLRHSRARGNQRKTKHATHPLRKAKGDASAASRGMPGDEEKRPPQIIPAQSPVIPASPTSFPRTREPREKQSTPLTPFAKQRGTRAQRAGDARRRGEAHKAPSIPRTPPNHSRKPPSFPRTREPRENKARLFSRSDSRRCPVPTRRGQPSSDEAHESKPPPPTPTLASPQSKPHHPRNTPSSKSAPPPSTGR